MADSKLSNLTTRGTPDRAVDQIYVINGGAEYRSTLNNELGISGNPVGHTDVQTLTNKTLTAPTISSPVLSGTITGTYTLGGTPTFPASVATLTGSQTLTNKVLTSPTINTPTITNASITADTITGFSTANSGTIYGLAITSGTISYAALPAGAVVQTVATNFSAVATGTTTIPVDDTIPQITEGTEFMTQAIAPRSATNVLVIEISAFISPSVVQRTIGALFQDSTANALAACETYVSTAAGSTRHNLIYTMVAGTTASTTFRYRVGGEGASTITFNGLTGARFYGAISKSAIKITEYKV